MTDRTIRLNLRVTPAERDSLELKAKVAGLSLSELLRSSALKRQLPVKVSSVAISTYRELGKIGVNLNQLTKAVNTANKMGHSFSIDATYLEELRSLLLQVQLEVAGANTHQKQTKD